MTARYDLVVVGAGPAGSMAARKAAESGLGVLLLEKARHPRPKACGGGLTGNFRRFVDDDLGEIIETRVRRVEFLFQGKNGFVSEPKGLSVAMVERERLDEFLAGRAVEAGAELAEETPLLGMRRIGKRFEIETPRGLFETGCVIGADGAAGPTARAAGIDRGLSLGFALDADLVHPGGLDEYHLATAVFDFGVIDKGYGWAFPRKKGFSAGVGTVLGKYPSARADLESLIKRHSILSECEVASVRGSPLPFWKGPVKCASRGVLLAGDAAGLVDPLSGEGISFAVHSGVLAAKYAAEYLGGSASAGAGYSEAIEREITADFVYARKLADLLFTYPRVCYHAGMRSSRVVERFVRYIGGETTYRELVGELKERYLGRFNTILRFMGKGG